MASLDLDPPPHLILNKSADCFDYVRVYSSGIMNPEEDLLAHSLFRFNVQLAMYVSVASFFQFFLDRFRVPKISSYVLAGFVLGSTFFERFFPRPAGFVFQTIPAVVMAPNVIMVSLAKIGYVFFTFMAGLRMDPSLISRMGKKTIVLGTLLALFPYLMTLFVDVKFVKDFPYNNFSYQYVVGVKIYVSMMTFGQFMGVSHLLLMLKITNSKIGHLALATQLVTDLLKFFGNTLSGFYAAWKAAEMITAVQSAFLCCSITLVMVYALQPLIYYFIRVTPEGQPVRKMHINLIIAVVLISSWFSELAGIYYNYGPFFIGLLVPAGSPLAQGLLSTLNGIVSGTLVPILVTFLATKFDLVWFLFESSIKFHFTMYAYFLKLVVTFVLSRICCKLSARDAAALTLILNYKGVLELGVILNFGNIELKDVDSTSGVLFVFIFATIIPPLVAFLYNPSKQYIGYEKKSVQFSSLESELKILACAHRQEDAIAAVKLLGYTNAKKESPLSIYALCLEELVASDTPVLINHKLNQKTSSSYGSRSQPIIDIFNYFQKQHSAATQVNVFTAVSHLPQMHEDICWLSFNKAASLIIIPFHKKWNSKSKKLMPGSDDLRTLNIDVLNRAPCSVAILIDRRGSQGLSSIFLESAKYNVELVFISGNDDREALAYAMRMAGSFRVQLKVIRLTFASEQRDDSWETMLDNESLRKLRQQMAGSDNIYFEEVKVTEGSEIATVVNEMQQSSDLIIVGRKHEFESQAMSQLSQWTEFPELGPIGDMLASEDIKTAVSALVVQQQIMNSENSMLLNRSCVY